MTSSWVRRYIIPRYLCRLYISNSHKSVGVVWSVLLNYNELEPPPPPPPPGQNGRHFGRRHFKRIFLNKTVWISVKISLKFVPKSPNKNIFQIMAWCRPGDKPLSEPTMSLFLLTHICVTRPQRVKDCVNNCYKWMIFTVSYIIYKWSLYRGQGKHKRSLRLLYAWGK